MSDKNNVIEHDEEPAEEPVPTTPEPEPATDAPEVPADAPAEPAENGEPAATEG